MKSSHKATASGKLTKTAKTAAPSPVKPSPVKKKEAAKKHAAPSGSENIKNGSNVSHSCFSKVSPPKGSPSVWKNSSKHLIATMQGSRSASKGGSGGFKKKPPSQQQQQQSSTEMAGFTESQLNSLAQLLGCPSLGVLKAKIDKIDKMEAELNGVRSAMQPMTNMSLLEVAVYEAISANFPQSVKNTCVTMIGLILELLVKKNKLVVMHKYWHGPSMAGQERAIVLIQSLHGLVGFVRRRSGKILGRWVAQERNQLAHDGGYIDVMFPATTENASATADNDNEPPASIRTIRNELVQHASEGYELDFLKGLSMESLFGKLEKKLGQVVAGLNEKGFDIDEEMKACALGFLKSLC